MDSQMKGVPRGPLNSAFIRLLYGILGTWLVVGAALLLYSVAQPVETEAMVVVTVMVFGAYCLAAVLWIRKGIRVVQSVFWNGLLVFGFGLVGSVLRVLVSWLGGVDIPSSLNGLILVFPFLGFWWLEQKKHMKTENAVG